MGLKLLFLDDQNQIYTCICEIQTRRCLLTAGARNVTTHITTPPAAAAQAETGDGTNIGTIVAGAIFGITLLLCAAFGVFVIRVRIMRRSSRRSRRKTKRRKRRANKANSANAHDTTADDVNVYDVTAEYVSTGDL